MMYMRFVSPKNSQGMDARLGIFQAAFCLKSSPTCSAKLYNELDDLLNWFERNLPSPSKFSRSSSKNPDDKHFNRGICWFKPTANEHIQKCMHLKALLDKNGYPIEIIRTNRIGYIIYEDTYQIVADPFKDTKR